MFVNKWEADHEIDNPNIRTKCHETIVVDKRILLLQGLTA